MEIKKVNVEEIKPNSRQIRELFENIAELSENIKEHGLIEPVMLRRVNGELELIHGGRRVRAAKKAGLKRIDAIIKDVGDKEAFELHLTENLQRDNLNPLEEARGYNILIDDGYTQEDIAKIAGKTQGYIAHKMGLLKLPEPLQFFLKRNLLSENHIRQLKKLKNIYPPGLTREIHPPRDEERYDAIYLARLRPEGRVLLIEPNGLIEEALRVFDDYVSKHNCEIPQWVVAAFWWASLVAYTNLPVRKLARAIRYWKERYYSAIAWMGIRGTKYQRKKHDDFYWGYWEDLRHSGTLELLEDGEKKDMPLETYEKAINLVLEKNAYIAPSNYKEWQEYEKKGG